MTGFWTLMRKELLEQRRTWRFLAMVIAFSALALLISIIPFIVTEVKDEPQGVEEAQELLSTFGFITVLLGTLLAIIVAMGTLANERATGTAAMTLSKPVTRLAFVVSKFLGLVLSIYGALAVASAVMFVLTTLLFDYWDLDRFAAVMAIVGVYLVFISSITFFWSGMFSRQLLAGGLAFFLVIVQLILMAIPHTEGYWPILAAEWGAQVTGLEEQGEPRSYSFAIALGAIAALSTGAWAVFRRKEL